MLGIQEIIENIDEQKDGKVISIIGAGGKTTLMYRLADFYAGVGRKVLVSTTTHIRKPAPSLYVDSLSELEGKWENGEFAVVGQEVKGDKLKSLDRQKLSSYMRKADVVLLEADGAKELPCKVPNETEPVVLEETNVILMVLGLDALGKRMRDVCFRLELAMDLLDEDRDHKMTEADFIVIIKHQLDRLREKRVLKDDTKCFVILNKCDTKKQKKQGEYILDSICKEEGYLGFLTKLI